MSIEISPEEKLKSIAYKELVIIALLFAAFVFNTPIIILAAFVAACFLVLTSSCEHSMYYLAFFTSFSGLFVYRGRHMFFVMAGIILIKFLLSNRVKKKTFLYYMGIISYSIVFCDINGEFSFAKLISIILLLVVPLIATSADKMNCNMFIKQYIFGFVIATAIGIFAMDIPAMASLLEKDTIVNDNAIKITRFVGIAYDSNFYALSNYTIVAYLLFGFKKLNKFRAFLILFLIIWGVQTVSKSYFLITIALLLIYFIKSVPNLKNLLLSFLVLAVGVWLFIYISGRVGYDVVELVIERFYEGDNLDITTGRFEIWKDYYEIFSNGNVKQILFGFGFNASAKKAAHNTFIELCYHYGFFGFFLWIPYVIYCAQEFIKNTNTLNHKSTIVLIAFITGIFFLSSLTYEAAWIGLVISLMMFGKYSKGVNTI